MSYPLDGPRKSISHLSIIDEKKPEKQCWPWCRRKAVVIQRHERELTQHEIDFTKIIRSEKAFEQKK